MHEIKLYGPIGGAFGIDAESFLSQVPAKGDVKVRIHSPGGSVGEGLAIYHGLKSRQGKTVTVVDGYAASTASFIMLAGDEVQVHPNSLIFVHNPWTQAVGNADELRKAAADLDVHAEAIFDIYRSTGVDEELLKTMMDGEEFFRGEDAVEMGFATHLIQDKEAEAQIAAMIDFESQINGGTMSKVKTRKEIEAEKVALQEELEASKVTHEEAVAGLEVVINEARAEFDARLEEVQSHVVKLEGEKAEQEKTIAEADAAIKALTEEKENFEADNFSIFEDAVNMRLRIEELNGELETAKKALENPAFADAVLAPSTEEIEAADAEADAAEAEVDENVTSKYDEFCAMREENPQASRTFWRENEEEIINEMKG